MQAVCSLFFVGVFVPATALAYALLPRRARPWLLLAASYTCFWLISGQLVIFLLACTLATYLAGRGLGVLQERQRAAVAQIARDRNARKAVKRRFRTRMRLAIAGAALVDVGILIVVKYLGFLSTIADSLLGIVGIDAHLVPPSIGVPIGISFYTLQALSYLFDIYRGSVRAERHLGRFALYMSFFPQLMEGPICRYGEMSSQRWAGEPVRARNVAHGALRIAWGAAKIIIVADRVNLFVKPVFAHPGQWGGTVIALSAVLYTLQLYCDFSGTMDIVLGVGRIFGIRLPENFRQPFFSRTASEFWQRWHITLGAWLRDYVFYPVSLSGPVKRFAHAARTLLGMRAGSVLSGGVALLAVWVLNGLWHGAGWRYLFFGLYYFVLILSAGLLEPVFEAARARLRINVRARPWIVFQLLRTCCIVCVGELFFRANGLRAGLQMFASMVRDFSPVELVDGTLLAVGMDAADFAVVGIFVLALTAVGLWRERQTAADAATDEPERAAVGGQEQQAARAAAPIRAHLAWQCAGIAALVLAIVIFGAYGTGYIPLDPIYAQF